MPSITPTILQSLHFRKQAGQGQCPCTPDRFAEWRAGVWPCSSDRPSTEGVGARLCARRANPCQPCRGAPVCAPVRGSNMLQRADTSVGPYRGSIVVLNFDGVANVRFVQRAGHAPPLQRNGFVFWWSCECFVRAAVEASLDPTKVPDLSAIYVGNGLARSAAHKKGASPGAPTCL